MALSYYSKWGPFQQADYSDGAIDDPELQSVLNADCYLVDPSDSFCNSPLSADWANNANGLLSSASASQQESFFHYYPKRQLYPSLFQFDPCLATLQDYSYSPLPDFAPVKKEASGGSLSAQSIAARQRRRRITVKTQELGKLVPGGHKMNTAEMLHSAYKYIKFLQAQVSLLESPPQEETKAPFEGEQEFHSLLESPLIQEKLYSTENCLVPHKLMEQFNPHLLPTLEKDR